MTDHRTSARSRVKSTKPTTTALRSRGGGGGSSNNNNNRDDKFSIALILKYYYHYVLALALLSSLIFIIIFIIVITNEHQQPQSLHRAITPFPAPKVMALPQFQGHHKESLYWGTYRPHLYLGIRARTPRSLLAGLMWIGITDGTYSMRHVCQDSDHLTTYGWTTHNGRDYGHQLIVDSHITLATSFIKSFPNGHHGYGGDWALRINVTQTEEWSDEMPTNVHLFFYLADEDGNALSFPRDTFDINHNSLLTSGSRSDIGNWQLHLRSKDSLEIHHAGFNTPHIHNLSHLVQLNLGTQVMKFNRLQLSDTSDESSNILVFQITGRIPFKTDIAFVSGTETENSRVEERVGSLTGTSLTSHLKEKQREFDKKFEKCFNLAEKLDSEAVLVGKAAIGNMLGGIGYFYGQSKISLPQNSALKSGKDHMLYWPAELYSAVPSRPFFPRGFLWDEGFHQLLIWRWDIRISLDIIGHWLDLMNIDGWIPREQILGAEALSKVPEEFVVQHPTNGNPPTLFLVLRDLVYGLKKDKFSTAESHEISSFLERSFVRLEAWYQWFNVTQSGKESSSYFWHGRDSTTTRELNPKTLSSGLDDYPRASHPSGEERHLDLRCWMLLASDCMHTITQLLRKEHDGGKDYGLTAKILSDFEILNQMHFDHAHGSYFDFGNHTEKVRLSWQETVTGNGHMDRKLVREVMEDPKLELVPHIGYVSLFPFMEMIIPPDSFILEKQLDIISNRSTLWTEYGLRSLARTSTLYMKRNTEHDPPYWRGPIWMNLNYRILSALHHYSKEDGPYRERAGIIYTNLRQNLIRTVVRNYRQTGFLWEQYDQTKGQGKGARLFTGWTSLVLLIMAESYPQA